MASIEDAKSISSTIKPARESTYEDSSITSPEEREKHFGQKDHLREFGKDYAEVLSRAGFMVEDIDFASSIDAKTVERYALASGEVSSIVNHIFVVRKP